MYILYKIHQLLNFFYSQKRVSVEDIILVLLSLVFYRMWSHVLTVIDHRISLKKHDDRSNLEMFVIPFDLLIQDETQLVVDWESSEKMDAADIL